MGICEDWIGEKYGKETGVEETVGLNLLETPFLFYLRGQQREKLDLRVPVKKGERSEQMSFPTVNI